MWEELWIQLVDYVYRAVKRKLTERGDPVSVPDAVAELSELTGNPGLDHVHEITIDCLQRGYLRAIREQGELRFMLTDYGKDYMGRMSRDH